jgi:hypothetical protein
MDTLDLVPAFVFLAGCVVGILICLIIDALNNIDEE